MDFMGSIGRAVVENDFFGKVFGNQARFNTSMNPLTPQQTVHMQRIFATLAGGVLMTAFGAWTAFNYFAFPWLVSIIAELLLIGYVGRTSSQHTDKEKNKFRFAAFGGISFLIGSNMQPLLAVANVVDPTLIAQALVMTCGVFACFFISASFSRKRAYLYIGPVLALASCSLAFVGIVNLFWKSQFYHSIHLYGGLFVSIGYIYYFCQKTLVDFELGNRDYLMHALRFYLELVSVFVRILVILIDKKQNKDKREEEKRR